MHFTVLACDLDGTLADHGEVAVETWELLRRARLAGIAIILVTGRALASFTPEGPYADLCSAIVAEDGAVVYFPRRDVVVFPFGRLDQTLTRRLEERAIPLEYGTAIVATHVPHDAAISEVLREMGGGATVEYNRGAVMVLPPGATKGTGLQYALNELGYSPRNVVACGDAENDRSLFEAVELAVAVANADPDIQVLADTVLPSPNGTGVRALLSDLIDGRIPCRSARPDRRLLLGHHLDGRPFYLDPLTLMTGNLGILGASGGGKSWLAGLLVEQILKQGYQVCIIDPEGDYRNLRAFPHTVLLGDAQTRLPPVADVVTLSEYANVSLVVDLSLVPTNERKPYVVELIHALSNLRAQRGRPHWFLIDEIQSFCPPGGSTVSQVLLPAMQRGGFCVISYRPTQIDPLLLRMLHHWLLTRLSIPEELEALAPFLDGAAWQGGLAQLPTLPLGQVYVALKTNQGCLTPSTGVVMFDAGARAVPHIRHLHKYLRAPLPGPKRFYFRDAAGADLGRSAASLWEFHELLMTLPVDSLAYHLQRGDFEQWVGGVLHDTELARQLRKIAHRNLHGEDLRQALVTVVSHRYEELDSLA